jgi:hypothetical protein
MESGLLDLANSTLELTDGAVITGETETARVFSTGSGYLQTEASLISPSLANPGNLGALISSSQNLGSVTIRRGHASQSNSFGNGSTVLRYYDILPTNNSGLNATLRFHYLEAELNGFDESNLTLWKSSDLQNWMHQGWTSRDVTLNYVEKAGIESFSRWTLSSLGNTLPVTLLRFTGEKSGTNVKLKWISENESQLSGYEIEKSFNGRDYHPVGRVFPRNAPGSHLYEYLDPFPGNDDVLFYRLKILEQVGGSRYSKIVRLDNKSFGQLRLYPNPAIETLNFVIQSQESCTATVELHDLTGRIVKSQPMELIRGTVTESLSLTGMQKGVYLVIVKTANAQMADRIVIQ